MPELPAIIHLPGPTKSAPKAKASRSGSETRRKDVVKPIRFTHSELAEATAAAEHAGQSLEDYLRDVAMQDLDTDGSEGHTTRRDAPIKYLRLTPDQLTAIEARASRAGLSFGSYVRARALKKPVTLMRHSAPLNDVELRRLVGLMGNVSSNLNQVARQLNVGRDVPGSEIDNVIRAVDDAIAQIVASTHRTRPRGAR